MKLRYGLIFAVLVALLALVNTDYRSDAHVRLWPSGSFENSVGGSPRSSLLPANTGYSPGSVRKARRTNEPYIVIDRYSNRLFLRTADSVILEALCSTGSGGELQDSLTGRQWKFETPGGVYTVDTKLENPWWRKPDWAFIEEGQPLPKSEQERFDANMMGEYAIGFGDGYFIHGTIYERLLGAAVTHGCVRLGTVDLRELYRRSHTGMRVYVF